MCPQLSRSERENVVESPRRRVLRGETEARSAPTREMCPPRAPRVPPALPLLSVTRTPTPTLTLSFTSSHPSHTLSQRCHSHAFSQLPPSHTHSDTPTLSHFPTPSGSFPHILSRTRTLSHTQSHSHTLTNSHPLSNTLRPPNTRAHSLSLSHTHSLRHTFSHAHSISHTLTGSRPASHTLSHSHAATHALSHTRTHTSKAAIPSLRSDCSVPPAGTRVLWCESDLSGVVPSCWERCVPWTAPWAGSWLCRGLESGMSAPTPGLGALDSAATETPRESASSWYPPARSQSRTPRKRKC